MLNWFLITSGGSVSRTSQLWPTLTLAKPKTFNSVKINTEFSFPIVRPVYKVSKVSSYDFSLASRRTDANTVCMTIATRCYFCKHGGQLPNTSNLSTLQLSTWMLRQPQKTNSPATLMRDLFMWSPAPQPTSLLKPNLCLSEDAGLFGAQDVCSWTVSPVRFQETG